MFDDLESFVVSYDSKDSFLFSNIAKAIHTFIIEKKFPLSKDINIPNENISVLKEQLKYLESQIDKCKESNDIDSCKSLMISKKEIEKEILIYKKFPMIFLLTTILCSVMKEPKLTNADSFKISSQKMIINDILTPANRLNPMINNGDLKRCDGSLNNIIPVIGNRLKVSWKTEDEETGFCSVRHFCFGC